MTAPSSSSVLAPRGPAPTSIQQTPCRTYCGSYGPALSAAKGLFPGCKTPVKNLFTCGASTFPGIGIPAVSASGAYAAEQIIGKKEFKTLLKKINLWIKFFL